MATRPAVFRCRPIRAKADRDREHDAQRRLISDTRRLYGSSRWKRLRADQLRAEPLCKFCFELGRIELATVCDHVEPHRGEVERFWSGPFQSLCAHHHNAEKQRRERALTSG